MNKLSQFRCPMCGMFMTEKEFARGWPREYKAVMKARKTEEALVVKEKAR